MYHPQVISAARAKLEEAFKRELREYTVPHARYLTAELARAVDKKGNPIRPILKEEQEFIANEVLITKIDFRYWAERYCTISLDGAGVGPMFPLLGSQQFLLDGIAELEQKIYSGVRSDGIVFNALKGARQVGISTFIEAIVAHRVTTQNNLNGLIASDVPGAQGASYIFGMMRRILDNLPWWLRPKLTDDVKDTEIRTDGGAHIWVGAGKSMKGKEGHRGQLGRSKTLSLLHLSELSTWEDAHQIDDSLMPTVPRSARTFCGFESTAKGRADWWHDHWNASKGPSSRFVPFFIPWYTRYRATPPDEWTPSETSLAHAKKVERTSAGLVGKTVRLSKEQLYWYESTRAEYETKGKLKVFLEEYGSADDVDCFQHSGRGIFSVETLQRIADQARDPVAIFEVLPQSELV